MNIDRIPHPHPNEGSWHLPIESPVTEGRSFRETPLNLGTEQGLRAPSVARACQRAPASRLDRARCRLQRRLVPGLWRDDELALHARGLMPRNAAIVDKIAGLRGAEGDRRARAFSRNARRFRVLIRKDNVMLGSLAVNKRELHDLSFCGRQDRIDLAINVAANTDEGEASIGDLCAQGVLRVGKIAGASGWSRASTRRGRRLWGIAATAREKRLRPHGPDRFSVPGTASCYPGPPSAGHPDTNRDSRIPDEATLLHCWRVVVVRL